MSWIEIIGTLFGFIYVILEILQKRAMWIVGAISALFYIALFFSSSLYAVAVLQFYYLAVSGYGWFKWGKERGENIAKGDIEVAPITVKLGLSRIVISSIGSAAVFVVVSFILMRFSKDPYPLMDSFIVTVSMLATWWVSERHIESWILWIVANLVAVIMFALQGLYITSLLYAVYIVASVVGYLHWLKFKRN